MSSLKTPLFSSLRLILALAYTAKRDYYQAARQLLNLAFLEDGSNLQVLSARDVAHFAGMMALASFSRDELRRHVIANMSAAESDFVARQIRAINISPFLSLNSNFKNYLDLVPAVRELIHTFYQSQYDRSLVLMEGLKNELRLDVYFREHVGAVYSKIREHAICQYFSPFLSVDMNRMAEAFGTDVRVSLFFGGVIEPDVSALFVFL